MASISAVLPAYNEEAIIRETARSMVATLEALTDDYEVIVVDDGSRDGTAAAVSSVAETNPRVRCVVHEVNQGYGAALATGFQAAVHELVFLTDGDKQFDPEELADFLPLVREADLVIGFRAPRRDPWVRRLNGWGWNLVVRLLFGYVARDVDCAFKLFRREILDHFQVESRGATFSAEFLIKARRLGFRIAERPVTHYPRTAGKATGARPSVIIRAFRELLALRLNLSLSPKTAESASHKTLPQR